LGVYAAMQLPAGVALDRFGPRRLLLTGTIGMVLGQTAMALAPNLPAALGARILIGAGDAMIFVSVIRLVFEWFPAPRVPLLTQLTGLIGQAGQLAAALPFAAALLRFGWVPAFLGLAASGLVLIIVATTMIPAWQPPTPQQTNPTRIREVAAHPGTWLGFWIHLLGGMGSTMFAMMWGVPFMVEGEGYPERTAAALLTTVVLTSVIAAPTLGHLTARYPQRRIALALGVAALVTTGWLIALIPATPLPVPAFVIVVILISTGGPASLIGLEIAAAHNAPARRSTAQGIANMGGFVGAIAVMLAVGAILDARTGGLDAGLRDYQIALSTVFIPMTMAVVAILLLTRRSQRRAGNR
ncbi:MAG: MFS transporter, partial [Promicromonosporaceae bacterium]|nr:MFS transporter [Promicromonosporaceae bacterium]